MEGDLLIRRYPGVRKDRVPGNVGASELVGRKLPSALVVSSRIMMTDCEEQSVSR
jgi:hypothetical protein